MLYFAHRGILGNFPQNSVPAFQKAKELGSTCYELDVHLTADEHLIVHHDYSLAQNLGINGEIGNYSLKDLRQISKNINSPIFPELSDVLNVILPTAHIVNIEIKNDENRYPNINNKLLEKLEAEGFLKFSPQIVFSSFNLDTLADLRKMLPKARIGALMHSFDIEPATQLKAESIHINYQKFTPNVAFLCHQNNMKCYLYTVNDTQKAYELSIQGADGIFTDRVDLFL